METSKDFEEFFELLNKHKVRYLVVGGYAFAIHAKPRFTSDIDILIEPKESNGQKVLAALKEFGFGSVGIALDDVTKPDHVIQLGQPPLRIDLLTSITDVSFAKAWRGKVKAKYGKQVVYFIGKKDLIVNKRGTGRKKDIEDLDELV
jgi:predicted nucleotidyltransferase